MASSPDLPTEQPWPPPPPRVNWKPLRRRVAIVLVLGIVAGLLVYVASSLNGTQPKTAAAPEGVATPTVIESPFAPEALRPLTPVEAEIWNRKVPEVAAVSPATPFTLPSANLPALTRSLQCMTAAIYYEAANEPLEGQRAVAQVILNRMRSPAYPHSVCGVVYQGSERKSGCQFTFTCDGSLARVPSATGWKQAQGVALVALSGYVYAPVGWATHYHADYVVPYWAQSLDKLGTIGRHIFYGWKGPSGTRAGFTSRYAGVEPDIAGLLPTTAPTTAAAGDPVAILEVTAAERPMIAHAVPEPEATPSRGATAAPTTAPDPVAAGARWVIGASPPIQRKQPHIAGEEPPPASAEKPKAVSGKPANGKID